MDNEKNHLKVNCTWDGFSITMEGDAEPIIDMLSSYYSASEGYFVTPINPSQFIIYRGGYEECRLEFLGEKYHAIAMLFFQLAGAK